MPGPEPPLEYANSAPTWRSRARRWRTPVFGVLVAGVAAALFGPMLWRQAQRAYYQRVALNYVPPRDFVSFEMRSGGGAGSRNPVEWVKYANKVNLPGPAYTLMFVGERRNTRGVRIVLVKAWDSYLLKPGVNLDPPGAVGDPLNHTKTLTLYGWVLERPSFGGDPRILGGGSSQMTVDVPPDQLAKWFGGRPDPGDAARVTFVYQFGPSAGTIEARLQDDDTIAFSVRDGPAATRPANLPAPP